MFYTDYSGLTKEWLAYIKGAKKLPHLQNLIGLFKFFTDSLEKKTINLMKADEVNAKVDKGVSWVICKEDVVKAPKKVLPCFHSAHTNWLKTRLLKNPLYFPCPTCKQNPNKEEQKVSYLDNMFDSKFLKEFGEAKSEAVIKQNLKHCGLCKAPFMIEEDEPNYNEKDFDGKKISEKAAQNKAQCRIVCTEWNQENWINCSATPYHNFQTWEEYLRSQETVKCRYCNAEVLDATKLGNTILKHPVCNKDECQKLNKMACQAILDCTHLCNGCKKSKEHLACLHPDCVEKNPGTTMGYNHNEGCPICMEELKTRPCVQLACKHIYDIECIMARLEAKWNTAQIDFSHLECPWCKAPIECDHSDIEAVIAEDRKFEQEVIEVAVNSAKNEGMDKDDFSAPPYNNDLSAYAMAKMAVYQCYECKKPYPAGKKECGVPNMKKEDWYWENWIEKKTGPKKGISNCDVHGKDYLIYKCRFWCSEATFFCWGTHHFCTPCHEKQEDEPTYELSKPTDLKQCSGPSDWPLGIEHPLNGTDEFGLRCGIC